jgi:N-acetylmuramic acid 6-phosphate etherase
MPVNEEPGLDTLDTATLVRRLHTGDHESVAAVEAALPDIVTAIEAIRARLHDGGRVLAVGAGTSGRLAALDAAELWPTYGWPYERWGAAMAGGRAAFWQAQEGAEDDRAAGAAVVAELGAADVILGVAASGRTPFVEGALRAGGVKGCLRVGLYCCRPAELDAVTDIGIHLVTGPEVVRGSTRMKAGSAQKMALNLISTGVMIRLGRVYGDIMIDMQVTNQKLIQRAIGFVRELTGLDSDRARDLLQEERWSVRRAVARYWTGFTGETLETWVRTHPNLRQVREADGRFSEP